MDIFSTERRSSIMARVKNKDSKLETIFRKELWGKGFRYRKNVSRQFGKPDIVLSKYKTVIFIDSCFWHYCPIHGELPKNNSDFWRKKLESNKKRDQKVNDYYKNLEWEIIRIWEHDLTAKNRPAKIEEVVRELKQRKR